MALQLIIFDCDGVLVDSETIANPVFCDTLTAFGIDMSYEESFATFTGLSLLSCLNIVEATFGKVLPPEFIIQYKEKVSDVLRQKLQPIKDIGSVLDSVKLPICVASGSGHERIRLSLDTTGLLSKFANNIFSASDVAEGKPAPDLFLYAAKEMGYAPEHCAVIEDSIPGVIAGVAAGMTVFAYAGTQKPDTLSKAGAHFIFDDMLNLPKLLNAFSR